MKEEIDQEELVATHALLVKRVRRIGIFVALIFVFAANLHFERLNHIKRESAVREAFLLSLSVASPLLLDVPPVPFASEAAPRLHRAIQNKIDLARVASPYSVFGLQLPFESYILLLLFGSTAALFALWVTLRQLRGVHAALAPGAVEGGALQRTLNSVFFPRFTLRYGQQWPGHVALGLLPVVLLAAATPLIVFSSGIMRLDPMLYPLADGSLSGQEDVSVIPLVIVSTQVGKSTLLLLILFAVDVALGLAALATGLTLPRRAGRRGGEEPSQSLQAQPKSAGLNS